MVQYNGDAQAEFQPLGGQYGNARHIMQYLTAIPAIISAMFYYPVRAKAH
ncbi:MAG: hypothetical protein LBR26_16425 [Prevotella sp.]|nr:hypothetical protein [Prevotella sp.]